MRKLLLNKEWNLECAILSIAFLNAKLEYIRKWTMAKILFIL